MVGTAASVAAGIGHTATAMGGMFLLGTGYVGTKKFANLMTDPKFVKWLGSAVDLPTVALPVSFDALATMYKDDPETQQTVQEYRDSVLKAKK
jgi:hypothetical protein